MDVVAVLEFGQQQAIIPIVLPFANEQTEVLLEFLIYALGLPVCLWMICHGCCHADA
jgi:hypothetical protein